VNLYRDGTDGVGWHADDEPENGVEPVIASVSLGATRRFDLRHRESGITIKTELEHGSVVVMSGLSQHCWVHQIAKTKTLVGPRINLTFRLVVDRRLGA
jgi:alkylated DNA repair dioxygenase AlkB